MSLSPIEGVDRPWHTSIHTSLQQVGVAPCHQGCHAPCCAETSAGHVAIVQPCQPRHCQTVGNHRVPNLGPAHSFIYTPLENHHFFHRRYINSNGWFFSQSLMVVWGVALLKVEMFVGKIPLTWDTLDTYKISQKKTKILKLEKNPEMIKEIHPNQHLHDLGFKMVFVWELHSWEPKGTPQDHNETFFGLGDCELNLHLLLLLEPHPMFSWKRFLERKRYGRYKLLLAPRNCRGH